MPAQTSSNQESSARPWFYTQAGEKKGPVTQEWLARAIQEGLLPMDVPSWSPGMGEWTAATRIYPIQQALSSSALTTPPPLPPLPISQEETLGSQSPQPPTMPAAATQVEMLRGKQTEQHRARVTPKDTPWPSVTDTVSAAEETSFQIVKPWTRLAARLFDLTLWSLVVGLILEIFSPYPFEGDPAAIAIVQTFIALATWVPIEAWLLSLWGGTPGKKLLKVEVVPSSAVRRLTLRESLARSLRVWAWGFSFGIPFLSAVANVLVHSRLVRKGITIWDEKGKLAVEHEEIPILNTIVAFVVLMSSWVPLFWQALPQ